MAYFRCDFIGSGELPDELKLKFTGNYQHTGSGTGYSKILLGGFPVYSLGYRRLSLNGSGFVNSQNVYRYGDTTVPHNGEIEIKNDASLEFYPATTQSPNLYDVIATFSK